MADLDLDRITRRRSALDELADRQAAALVERERQAAELEDLQRRGDRGRGRGPGPAAAGRARRRTGHLGRRRGVLLDGIDELAGVLASNT